MNVKRLEFFEKNAITVCNIDCVQVDVKLEFALGSLGVSRYVTSGARQFLL